MYVCVRLPVPVCVCVLVCADASECVYVHTAYAPACPALRGCEPVQQTQVGHLSQWVDHTPTDKGIQLLWQHDLLIEYPQRHGRAPLPNTGRRCHDSLRWLSAERAREQAVTQAYTDTPAYRQHRHTQAQAYTGTPACTDTLAYTDKRTHPTHRQAYLDRA